MPRNFHGDKYVVCSDEGEPGTFKIATSCVSTPFADRRHDHCGTQWVLKAGYNYIHGEIFEVYELFEAALDQARKQVARHQYLGFRL